MIVTLEVRFERCGIPDESNHLALGRSVLLGVKQFLAAQPLGHVAETHVLSVDTDKLPPPPPSPSGLHRTKSEELLDQISWCLQEEARRYGECRLAEITIVPDEYLQQLREKREKALSAAGHDNDPLD